MFPSAVAPNEWKVWDRHCGEVPGGIIALLVDVDRQE
jgi:hypothetical protein